MLDSRLTKACFIGFTLADALISLSLVGVIASFSVRKVLVSTQNHAYNLAAKEAVGTLGEACQERSFSGLSNQQHPLGKHPHRDIISYVNYTKIDTSGVLVDKNYGHGSWACDDWSPCARLVNGSVLHYVTGYKFEATSNSNAIFFKIDPVGKYSGSTFRKGKSLKAF
ncbi:MAG: hypothetical protein VKJ06_05805 [Vampirovibrionales bacterium]|nr:hypothetical protein [Vampirovibrionales bacterium]